MVNSPDAPSIDIFTADLSEVSGPDRFEAFLQGVAAVASEAYRAGFIRQRNLPLGYMLEDLVDPSSPDIGQPDESSELLEKARRLNGLYNGLYSDPYIVRAVGASGMDVVIDEFGWVEIFHSRR